MAFLSGHAPNLNDPIFLASTLGAMLPDLDIVTHVKGRLNYLLKHRGASHSLLALGGMALGLGTVVYSFFPETPWNTIIFWALAGTLSHGIVDILNSFGAELLWPFYKKKLTVEMIILTDPVIFSLFLLSLLVSFFRPEATQVAGIAFLGSGLYLIYRHIGRLKIREALMKRYHLTDVKQVKILPAMYRPFSWNFLLFEDDFVCFGTIRDTQTKIERVLPRWDETNPYVSTAMEGAVAEIFDQFTPYYHIVTAEDENAEYWVEFMDLRYWTRENFLYTGKVVMNSEGEIAEERFHATNREGILLSY